MAAVAGLLAAGALAAPAAAATDGTIQGTFTTSSGDPVRAAVYIAATDYSTQLNLNTDGTGAFQAQVPAGDYHISFSWGSATQWAYQDIDQFSAATITVAAGQTTQVDDHKLPTGTVGGHLRAADGSPLASATVVLYHGDDAIDSATTNRNGDYSFGETFARDGYSLAFYVGSDAEQWVPGAIAQSQARTFAITADARTTEDDTQIAAGAVQGRLADPDGNPESGYQVFATFDDHGTAINYYATTDRNGEWNLAQVFPGTYRVSFASPENQRTQWAYGASTAADAKLITVAAGAPVVVDDTWLPPAQLVISTVDATTGAAVPGFCFYVETPNTPSDCVTSNHDTLDNLPGGTFQLRVTPNSGSYYLRKDIAVTLTPGQTTTLTVPLALGGKVAFSAADHVTGAPVAGTCGRFMMIGQGGVNGGHGDCTDTAGTAVTGSPLAAGTYELFTFAPGSYGDQWVGKHGGTGNQKAAARIVVQPGTTVTAPTALLDPAGTVTGVVTGSDGTPLANGVVAATAWDGSGSAAVITGTDANGKYTLGQLGPYAWPLLFGGGTDPNQWSGHVANRFQATGVPVTAGGTTTYDMNLIKGAELTGTIKIPNAPAASWSVIAYNAATGDQMGIVGGRGRPYSWPLTGGTAIKIAWEYSTGDPFPAVSGWYRGATGRDTATKVGIPADGSKKLNLTLG